MHVRTTAAMAIATILLSFDAHAQTQEEQQACTYDAQIYCQEQMPDHRRVEACLRRNIRAISPACREVLTRHSGKRRHRP
jgi:hypothetical protein